MWRFINAMVFTVMLSTVYGQTWQWTELSPMPMRTSNNALCEATVGANEYIYSFGGIDSTKIYSGIHNRAFKYTVATDTWMEMDTLPDAQVKIASAASFVNGKIYILGGYHVFAGGSEVSSNKVHIYNPQTDQYEADGSPIPVPIDDHVQCVYKDSLIFVVTGWSNVGNVANVQIYNPALDQWQVGTSTPNTTFFKAFGASGYIIGDTLYYHGGAAGGSFAARAFMRKGYINPTNPLDITWEQMPDAPGLEGYRAACSGINSTVFWVGGSAKSYNYNGIAYDGTGGVDPSARIIHYNNAVDQYLDEIPQEYGVMDLRGIAKLPNNRWIIAGGMDTNQVVSNRTFLLESQSVGLEALDATSIVVKYGSNEIVIETNQAAPAKLLDMKGQVIQYYSRGNQFIIKKEEVASGIYLFVQGNTNTRIRI